MAQAEDYRNANGLYALSFAGVTIVAAIMVFVLFRALGDSTTLDTGHIGDFAVPAAAFLILTALVILAAFLMNNGR